MTAVLIAIVLKGSILMGAAAALVALMGRASAATRHAAWTLAIAGLLCLPVFSTIVPTWEIAMPLAPTDTRAWTDTASDARMSLTDSRSRTGSERAGAGVIPPTPSAPVGSDIPWAVLAAAMYVLAVALLLGRLIVQGSAARRIVSEATLVTEPAWTSALDNCIALVGVQQGVTLRRSREQLMPMTTGTLTPAIVIPADSDTWNDDRRRAVLLHELAHIARRDCLTQMLTAIACALYCFHPGIWYIAHRLRIERELACDDRVLAAGAHASDYAGHLLELAYQWSGRRAPALAVGMASSHKLEGRMRAVLDPERNRAMPTRRAWLAGAAVAAGLLLPLAAVTMTRASADVRIELMASSNDRHSLDEVRIVRTQSQDGSTASQDTVTGTWEVRRSNRQGRLSVTVSGGGLSMNGDIDESELDALTSQSLSNASGPIRFSIRRAAGMLEIEGMMREGTGSGTFTFVPNQAFIASLASRGFARPTARQLFALAQSDVGLEFIDLLAKEKYTRPDLADLVNAAHHGVNADFVRGMADTGYRVGTLDILIRLRDHGVDPDFVRGLRALGVSDLSPDDLVRFRDHGVDPDYVSGMRQAGYRPEPLDLVRARDHGVDANYVAVLREVGYTSVDLEDVIRARDHGLDPEYLRDMRDVGYTLTLPDLIRARDHGVTPDYVVALAVQGYKGLPIETLIRMRDHGVSPEYVLEIQKRGIEKPDAEELIRMRDRGARGYEEDIRDALARLRDHVEQLARELFEKPAAGNAR
jgi:beta-lactamase regulating signal transducer with metallopeptidase domain